ncbi:YqkE family protein [Paenibacillus sepulcri]|uniref:YqkE family protein n=1 Tax=Paenibacillus sepulcri TaxID=359917 RepID=UPI0035E8CEBD
MAKKNKTKPTPKAEAQDKPATLRDLLRPDVLEQLKAQSDALKADEAKAKEEQRLRAEEAANAEKKRLENDFGHLLKNSSMDWRKHK